MEENIVLYMSLFFLTQNILQIPHMPGKNNPKTSIFIWDKDLRWFLYVGKSK